MPRPCYCTGRVALLVLPTVRETRSVKDIGSCIGVTALLYSTDISRARYEARGSGAGRSSQLLLSSAKCSRLSAAAQPREAGSSEGRRRPSRCTRGYWPRTVLPSSGMLCIDRAHLASAQQRRHASRQRSDDTLGYCRIREVAARQRAAHARYAVRSR